MKKTLVILLVLLASSLASAAASMTQADSSDFRVKSFRKLEWDLDARSNYPMIDQNGRKAALIKVVISGADFDFDVGVMGIVGIKQEVGEIWVYVPENVQKITIRHSDYGIIRDYRFGIPIESATVYELVLQIPRKPAGTVVVKDSIVYVPAPAPAAEPEKPKRKPVGISVLPVLSAGGLSSGDLAFGGMVAYRRPVGAYLKGLANFRSSEYAYLCSSDGTTPDGFIWTSGNTRVSRFSVSAGGTLKCAGWLDACAGAGYGSRILLWEDTDGAWAKVEDASLQGILAELGAMMHFGRLTVYAGVSSLRFRRVDAEVGVGFLF